MGKIVSVGECGFLTRDTSTIAFTDGNRTFSIQPTGTSFEFWVQSVRYVTTGDTVVISDTEGIHAIYYDGSVLTTTANPTVSQVVNCIKNTALVSLLYWNAADNEAIYVGEERHGLDMSGATHVLLHFRNGLAYLTGLALSTMVVDGDGDTNSHAQFGIELGRVSDEDIAISIAAVTSTTGLPIYYMLGASAAWKKETVAGYSVLKTGTGGEDRLAWNEYTGGAWQLTEVPNADFVLCHVFATTEKDNPMIAIVGQNVYPTKRSARTGAEVEVQSLILNDILFPEILPIATIIYQTKDTYANTMNAKVVSTDEGADYVDWRRESVSRTTLTTSDHNSLVNVTYATDGVEFGHINDNSVNRNLAANFRLLVKAAHGALGYVHSFGENFFEDNSADPGTGYTPTTTEASVDTVKMLLETGATGATDAKVYWSDVITPAASKTSAWLQMDCDLNGGTVVIALLEDDDMTANGGAGFFDTLVEDTDVVLSNTITSYRLKVTLTNASGISPELFNFIVATK